MTPLQSTVHLAANPPVKPIFLNPTLTSSVMKTVVAQSNDMNYQGSDAAPTVMSGGSGIPTWVYVVGGLAVAVGGYMLLKR